MFLARAILDAHALHFCALAPVSGATGVSAGSSGRVDATAGRAGLNARAVAVEQASVRDLTESPR
jgi:hypothetical protein